MLNKEPKERKTKLSDELIELIKTEYNFGKQSLRAIAEKYNISHEYVRLIANKDIITREQVAVHKLINEHFDEFMDYIDRGVSPPIAARMFGINAKAFSQLVSDNPEISDAILNKQALSISRAEICLASASGDSWKAALERLSRNPLTRHDYITNTNTNSAPTITVNMSWNRDELAIPCIEVSAKDFGVCNEFSGH